MTAEGKKKARLYGVGVGPGDSRHLTLRAVEVLQEADVIAMPKSRSGRESVAWEIAREFCGPESTVLEVELPMTAERDKLELAWKSGAEAILKEIRSGKRVAFITLGDPSLYSTYSHLLVYLKHELSEEDIETVPGITAMSAAAARLNIPLALGDEPLLIVPNAENMEAYLKSPNLVIMKTTRNLPDVLSQIKETGRQAVLVTRVGQTGERMMQLQEEEFPLNQTMDYLSLLLVKPNV